MDKTFLEKRLLEQAEKEAYKEFVDSQDYIAAHPVLRKLYPYKGQFTIAGQQLTRLYIPEPIDDIESAIKLRAEEIYKNKVDNLLRKLDGIEFLFEEGR